MLCSAKMKWMRYVTFGEEENMEEKKIFSVVKVPSYVNGWRRM